MKPLFLFIPISLVILSACTSDITTDSPVAMPIQTNNTSSVVAMERKKTPTVSPIVKKESEVIQTMKTWWETDSIQKPITPKISEKIIPEEKKSLKNTEASLRERLTNAQYEVTQNGATETPYKNLYWDNYEAGIYVDIIDGSPLFSSLDKFDTGTGWPSFTKSIIDGALEERSDKELETERTEVISRTSSSHLGHVFDDGPVDKWWKRYCINSASLRFIPVSELKKEWYGTYTKLFQ